MGKQINEKTLEINLCSEMSRFFRLLGFQSVWRGLSQHEEKKWGFDGSTSLPDGRLIFIQWKASKGLSRTGEYKFTLNDFQMSRLVALSRRYPSGVFYGLPQVSDWIDFRRQHFFALPDTRFFPARVLGSHPSLGKQLTHTATIQSGGSKVQVTSIPQLYDGKRVESLFGVSELSQLLVWMTGAPNFMMTRRQGSGSLGFSVDDEFHPKVLEIRNSFLQNLPVLNQENYESAEGLFDDQSSRPMQGLYAAYLFDVLKFRMEGLG